MPNDLNKNSTTHATVTLCKKRKLELMKMNRLGSFI